MWMRPCRRPFHAFFSLCDGGKRHLSFCQHPCGLRAYGGDSLGNIGRKLPRHGCAGMGGRRIQRCADHIGKRPFTCFQRLTVLCDAALDNLGHALDLFTDRHIANTDFPQVPVKVVKGRIKHLLPENPRLWRLPDGMEQDKQVQEKQFKPPLGCVGHTAPCEEFRLARLRHDRITCSDMCGRLGRPHKSR